LRDRIEEAVTGRPTAPLAVRFWDDFVSDVRATTNRRRAKSEIIALEVSAMTSCPRRLAS